MNRKMPVAVLAAVWAIFASPFCMADTSLGLRFGTLGGGIELAHAFTDTLGFRVSANGLNYDASDTYEDINYDADVKLETAHPPGLVSVLQQLSHERGRHVQRQQVHAGRHTFRGNLHDQRHAHTVRPTSVR
ncbi:MAG: hypothetical protein H7X76_04710 [Prolixibacteraceae bacterium]|nr:hypothetical protein [Burkholderiales bacterium]